MKIEKGTTDRRLVPKYQITKSNLTFASGGYFFVFVFSIIFNNNVTTILSIISTMDKSSKSLIRIPSALLEGLTAYRIMVAP